LHFILTAASYTFFFSLLKLFFFSCSRIKNGLRNVTFVNHVLLLLLLLLLLSLIFFVVVALEQGYQTRGPRAA
jgi:hypothetical protein